MIAVGDSDVSYTYKFDACLVCFVFMITQRVFS